MEITEAVAGLGFSKVLKLEGEEKLVSRKSACMCWDKSQTWQKYLLFKGGANVFLVHDKKKKSILLTWVYDSMTSGENNMMNDSKCVLTTKTAKKCIVQIFFKSLISHHTSPTHYKKMSAFKCVLIKAYKQCLSFGRKKIILKEVIYCFC